MVWYIIAGIVAAIALILLVFNFIRDRMYERKRALDAMSPELRAEIEDERALALERMEHFKEAMGEAVDKDVEKDTAPHDDVP
jgi:hypothetical protein